MNPARKTAIAVGLLYIAGTVAGIASVIVTNPVFGATNLLKAVSENPDTVVVGSLLVMLMAFALALVPALLFPVLKRTDEALAVGYAIMRGGVETVMVLITSISWLLLIPLGREYGTAAAEAQSLLGDIATLLKGIGDLPTPVFAFGLGAILLYCALYRARLIPRWISVWGLIAIALHLATGFMGCFGLLSNFSTLSIFMNLPIMLQEMVMAVWFIAKGFDPSRVAIGEESRMETRS